MPNEHPFNSSRGCESAANEVSFITDTESERIEDRSCQLNFCEIIFWVTRLKGCATKVSGHFLGQVCGVARLENVKSIWSTLYCILDTDP